MLKIKEILQKEGYNITTLANKIGVRRQRLTKCINKNLDFTIEELENINKVFNDKYNIEEFLQDIK